MDLRKISTILNLFLDLSEEDQKVLLNLLTPTPPPKVGDFLEEFKKAAEKSSLPDPIPRKIPLVSPPNYPPYIKKSDPFYPTIMY